MNNLQAASEIRGGFYIYKIYSIFYLTNSKRCLICVFIMFKVLVKTSMIKAKPTQVLRLTPEDITSTFLSGVPTAGLLRSLARPAPGSFI